MLHLFRQSSSCGRSGIPPTSLLVRQTLSLLSVVRSSQAWHLPPSFSVSSSGDVGDGSYGNGNAPGQALKASLTASLRHRDFGGRTDGQPGEVEQLERLLHTQTENSQLVPFRTKRAKEAKELIVLDSLIPDCRLTAGVLSREAA